MTVLGNRLEEEPSIARAGNLIFKADLKLRLMKQVEKWFGKTKELASLRTVTSHIENMFTGVLKGFRYV